MTTACSSNIKYYVFLRIYYVCRDLVCIMLLFLSQAVLLFWTFLIFYVLYAVSRCKCFIFKRVFSMASLSWKCFLGLLLIHVNISLSL